MSKHIKAENVRKMVFDFCKLISLLGAEVCIEDVKLG